MKKNNISVPPAVISTDQKHRYILSREWIGEEKTVCFIGLNPSTADEKTDDPTIRRCINFSKLFNGNRLIMVNLFTYRSKNPSDLLIEKDRIGPEYDTWLDFALENSDLIIASWGNNSLAKIREEELASRLRTKKIYCLQKNKNGTPKHPLYVPNLAELISYNI